MPRQKATTLSKSRYLDGLKCPKLLWCHFNAPEKIPEPDAATQATFDQGHEVGNLAKLRYPGGIEVPFGKGASDLTKELLKKRATPIFEASFFHKECICKTDILVPVHDDEWDLIEVKSSTKVKAEHVEDVAFQRWCIENAAGLKLRRTHVMFVNNEYVLCQKDGIDPQQLLAMDDVTEEVEKRLPAVEDRVNSMFDLVRGPMPKPEPGVECKKPEECPMCSDALGDADILDISGLGAKRWSLLNGGVRHVKDLPHDFKLNPKQEIQRQVILSGRSHVDKAAINQFLDKLRYPLYLLDFETIGPAIPLFEGTRPYQQVPFQFSLHILSGPAANNTPNHTEFLADGACDPRPALVQALKKAIGPEGTVLAYFASFEHGVLEELAQAFPQDSAWLHSVIDRIDDLILPFKSLAYYHPKQHGSNSLKAVLPALTNGKTGYDGLEIREGTAASNEYMRIITFGNDKVSEQEEKKRVRAALLEYCKQDTNGMIDILRVLRESATN